MEQNLEGPVESGNLIRGAIAINIAILTGRSLLNSPRAPEAGAGSHDPAPA